MQVVMDMEWIAFLADDAGRQIGLITTDATAPVNPDISVFVDDVEAAHSAAVAAGVAIVEHHQHTIEKGGDVGGMLDAGAERQPRRNSGRPNPPDGAGRIRQSFRMDRHPVWCGRQHIRQDSVGILDHQVDARSVRCPCQSGDPPTGTGE